MRKYWTWNMRIWLWKEAVLPSLGKCWDLGPHSAHRQNDMKDLNLDVSIYPGVPSFHPHAGSDHDRPWCKFKLWIDCEVQTRFRYDRFSHTLFLLFGSPFAVNAMTSKSTTPDTRPVQSNQDMACGRLIRWLVFVSDHDLQSYNGLSHLRKVMLLNDQSNTTINFDLWRKSLQQATCAYTKVFLFPCSKHQFRAMEKHGLTQKASLTWLVSKKKSKSLECPIRRSLLSHVIRAEHHDHFVESFFYEHHWWISSLPHNSPSAQSTWQLNHALGTRYDHKRYQYRHWHRLSQEEFNPIQSSNCLSGHSNSIDVPDFYSNEHLSTYGHSVCQWCSLMASVSRHVECRTVVSVPTTKAPTHEKALGWISNNLLRGRLPCHNNLLWQRIQATTVADSYTSSTWTLHHVTAQGNVPKMNAASKLSQNEFVQPVSVHWLTKSSVSQSYSPRNRSAGSIRSNRKHCDVPFDAIVQTIKKLAGSCVGWHQIFSWAQNWNMMLLVPWIGIGINRNCWHHVVPVLHEDRAAGCYRQAVTHRAKAFVLLLTTYR